MSVIIGRLALGQRSRSRLSSRRPTPVRAKPVVAPKASKPEPKIAAHGPAQIKSSHDAKSKRSHIAKRKLTGVSKRKKK